MDVVALGELLIDFTENGVSNQGNPLFEANPGGAPCNVLAMLSRLGHKTAFIGKVGNDFFGKQLEDAIKEVGIDAAGLLKDDEVHTTLALVHTQANGDRDFSFYRNPGADMMLTENEIPEAVIRDARIFHFGTLSMTHEMVRKATKKAIALAKESGAIISFDPNIREPLWSSLEEAREIHLASEYTKGGYGQYDEEIEQCIREEFALNGVAMDGTYTGKAFLGMEHYIEDHQISGKKILFIHTGGTPLFYDWLGTQKKDLGRL